MRRDLVCIALMLLTVCVSRSSFADLYAEFKSPPREYSPVPFWFLNADLESSELAWQIDRMMEQGVYGALMHGRTGLLTPYFSDDWWQAIGAAVEHASEKGFRAWIYDEFNWPSGHANGEVMRGHPEFFPRNIEVSSTKVEGPGKYSAGVNTDGLIAVLASKATKAGIAPEPSEDLTSLVREGRLEWDIPPGKHVVMVAREATHDHYVDVLNADAMDRFLGLTHREYARRFGEHFGSVIPGTFTDEPNIRSFFNPAWTADFLEHFREIKGYDFTPYLGALFHDMGSSTIKARCDYYDVITTLYERNYWGLIGGWAEKQGVVSTGHLKAEEDLIGHMRMAGDAMRVLRHAQVPGIDLVTGPRLLEVQAMKLGSSVAHLYGRDRVMSESFAGCGHALTFQEMKWMSDWQYAGGVNLLVPHAFHYSIEGPGDMRRNDWPPSMFYQQPYWPHYSHYASYISRLSRMLSGGVHVADIAVHYPIKTMWAGSGPVGTDDRLCLGVYDEVLNHLFESNLDYDLIDDDSLERAEVEDGTLRVGLLSFKAVVLPATRVLTQAGAKKLAEFQSQGGVVVCVARRPNASAESGEGDESVAAVANKSVFVGTARGAQTVLRKLISTDFEIVRGERLYYNHVRHPDADVYFVSSQLAEEQDTTIRFRAQGFPELWDAETGEAFALPYAREGSFTVVDLPFSPHGSHLVVFRTARSALPPFVKHEQTGSIALPEVWQFEARPYHYRNEELPPGYDASAEYPTTIKVGDWCAHGMEAFSGTGVYRAEIEIDATEPDERLFLDLGDARVAATVYVNGASVGTRIWQPYVFDITDQVHAGRNAIRIEVTNTIANRMTLFKTGRWDETPRGRLASGLIGPVRLYHASPAVRKGARSTP